MSQVGKTVVKGHGLLNEGRQYFTASGQWGSSWVSGIPDQYGRCACGELFGPGWSQAEVKRAHRQHKADVVANQ